MYVCLFVTDKLQIDSSFLFLDGIEPFWPSFLHVALYKTLFFDFWFRPLTPKLYSQNFGKKSITGLVWQIDRRCLDILGGFQGWPIQWNHTKCCGADPCCHGNDIWARRGDLNAYRLVLLIIVFANNYISLPVIKLK